MKNYNFNLRLFLIIGAQISLALTGFSLLLLNKVNLESLKSLIIHNELILLPLILFYFYFENIGWRQGIWKWSRIFLKFPPDIRGRWEGKLTRINPADYDTDFVLEVEQTMTKLQVYTYAKSNSESVSILEEIASDIKHEKNFKLCYLWEGNSTKLPNQKEDSGKFIGYSILTFRISKQSRELIGDYFTNRKPYQTSGKIELKWVSFELKKKF